MSTIRSFIIAIPRAFFISMMALSLPTVVNADVLPGFDLIITQDGTEFDPDGAGPGAPIPVTGVPIGLFDFGGTTGVVDVGDVDTIIERTGTATDGSPTVNTEILALQLVTVDPVDLGAGLGFYYVTLQSERGVGDPPPGPDSTGQLTFDTPVDTGGTVTGFFDIFVDIRFEALDGLIVASIEETLQLSTEKDSVSASVPWSSDPWGTPIDPLPPVDWETSLLIKHGVVTVAHPDVPNGGFFLAHIPEPSVTLMLSVGGLVAPIMLRRRRMKSVVAGHVVA